MKQKRIDLEIMRILACFFVIFNHVSGYGLYMVSDSVAKIWVYMCITMLTRINVPLFLMISGILLLGNRGGARRRL